MSKTEWAENGQTQKITPTKMQTIKKRPISAPDPYLLFPASQFRLFGLEFATVWPLGFPGPSKYFCEPQLSNKCSSKPLRILQMHKNKLNQQASAKNQRIPRRPTNHSQTKTEKKENIN